MGSLFFLAWRSSLESCRCRMCEGLKRRSAMSFQGVMMFLGLLFQVVLGIPAAGAMMMWYPGSHWRVERYRGYGVVILGLGIFGAVLIGAIYATAWILMVLVFIAE